MLTKMCFGDLWINKVSITFLQQLDLKNKKNIGTIIPIRHEWVKNLAR